MQLFLIIFLIVFLFYFGLYFFRLKRKKIQEEHEMTVGTPVAKKESQVKQHPHDQPAIPRVKKDRSIDEWIVLKLIAKKGKPYQGYEMIQTLLGEGLRFGQFNIFHRHEDIQGKGERLFSLASVAKPGTFDLNHVGTLKCVGFVLFFSVKKVKDAIKVLNLMVQTAQRISEELGGSVYTQKHQLLTELELQHMHLHIQSLQKKLHTPDLFINENY
jgi:cell division protein ZipA